MTGAAFTSSYNGLSNALKNNVSVARSATNNTRFPAQQFVALWDTGATKSVITKDIVEALDLKPVSVQRASTPSGTYTAYCYYIDLILPNQVYIPKLLVIEGQPMGCNILIGMDVIGRGDFAVSNYNGKTSFSFRMPSCTKLDFVEHSYIVPIKSQKLPGRNEQCPCGSGKKYKNCCGKNDL